MHLLFPYGAMRLLLFVTFAISYAQDSGLVPSTIWSAKYGADGDEYLHSIEQTKDGGYIVAGMTNSTGTGKYDACLLKLDSAGVKEWTRYFGGPENDIAYRVVQTFDSGYAFTGTTISGTDGSCQIALNRTDPEGTLLWHTVEGGNGDDKAFALVQMPDSGFMLAGCTNTEAVSSGGTDAFLWRTDKQGNCLWYRTYGGVRDECAYSIIRCPDGNLAIAGAIRSSGTSDDAYLMKVDPNGNRLWFRRYGGDQRDVAYSVKNTVDGGFVLVGSTHSYGEGQDDAFLLKTDAAGKEQWMRLAGGLCSESAYDVAVLADGGYAVVGNTFSYNDEYVHTFVIRTNPRGIRRWLRYLDGSVSSTGKALVAVNDSTFVVGGHTNYESYNVVINQVSLAPAGPPSEVRYRYAQKFTCITRLDSIGFTGIEPTFWQPDVEEGVMKAVSPGGWDALSKIYSREFQACRRQGVKQVYVDWRIKYPSDNNGPSWRENNKLWVSICDSSGNRLYTVEIKPNRREDLYTSFDLRLTKDDDRNPAVLAEEWTHTFDTSGPDAQWLYCRMELTHDDRVKVWLDYQDGRGPKKYINVRDRGDGVFNDFSSLLFQYKTGVVGEGNYTIFVDNIAVKEAPAEHDPF